MATVSERLKARKRPWWASGKRYLWLLASITPLCTLLASHLVMVTGLRLFWWTGPILILVVIPIVDFVIGDNGQNPSEDVFDALQNNRFFRWCTFLYLPFQVLGLFWAAHLWSLGVLTPVDSLGLATTAGVVAGIGINTAHELGHRREGLERWLSRIALAQSCYGHFYTEHNLGHHVRVATPEDPASARFGEGYWSFLPRSVIGGLRSALKLEKARLSKLHRPWWSWSNQLLTAWGMSVVLYAVVVALYGAGVLPYLIVQAAVGIALLEAANYLEHYGLLRQKTASGRYERPAPRHSWNSDRIGTNLLLFQLQRHSDHHANPGRRYQTLRTFEEAPQLPSGYATMIDLAMFPPLWRKVMDRRLLAFYGGDLSRINVVPRKRDAISAKLAGHPRAA